MHQEIFWEGGVAVYRPAGGYARIATVVKGIRADHPGQTLFCDCGDTLHGTYLAQETQGEALIPVLNALGLELTGQEIIAMLEENLASRR